MYGALLWTFIHKCFYGDVQFIVHFSHIINFTLYITNTITFETKFVEQFTSGKQGFYLVLGEPDSTRKHNNYLSETRHLFQSNDPKRGPVEEGLGKLVIILHMLRFPGAWINFEWIRSGSVQKDSVSECWTAYEHKLIKCWCVMLLMILWKPVSTMALAGQGW